MNRKEEKLLTEMLNNCLENYNQGRSVKVRVPDPIELLDSRIETLMDEYIDENTCMQCKKKVDYELYCLSPIGNGPALCAECAGITE